MNVDLTPEHIAAIEELQEYFRYAHESCTALPHVAVLETLLPRPIAVGDTVETTTYRRVVVVAIDDDAAGVSYGDGIRGWLPLDELTRVAS